MATKRRPKIAINCDFDPGDEGARYRRRVVLYEPYVKAVVEAGGLPLLVPPSPPDVLAEYLALADGLLFTGGRDYPPATYQEDPHPTVQTQTRERTDSDLALMRLALDSKKPALGICAGLQLMNIAGGGGLIQHLPQASDHTAKGMEEDSSHAVEVYPETALAGIFGAGRITVNSAHHQAANPSRLAGGLKVSARAEDGTIEGLELERPGKRFFVFVQWHPERIEDPEHRRKIFSAFVRACRPA